MKNAETNCCDDSTAQQLLNLDKVLERLLVNAQDTLLSKRTAVEKVKLNQALNRVLAEDLVSAIDVPPADNSAVDGYALFAGDLFSGDLLSSDLSLNKILPVSQRIPAGSVPEKLKKGSAARIFTGASIPEGADCVIMQEQALPNDPSQSVQFSSTPSIAQNIRSKGQDIKSGQVILKKGQLLSPQRLGLAASIGMDTLKVVRPLRVAIFSTGDELVEPGQAISEGQIFNSNRYMLSGLLQSLHFEIIDLGVIPDNLLATETALTLACKQADVVITTGGASVGEEDHIQDAIKALGQIDFWRVAIKPGKPFMYGCIDKTPILGLPGNPGAVFVTFSVLARPFLLCAQGVTNTSPTSYPLALDFDLKRAGPRREFLRVKQNEKGQLCQHPNQSSGMLSSASWAEGFAVIQEHTCPKKGEFVEFIPFSNLFTLPH